MTKPDTSMLEKGLLEQKAYKAENPDQNRLILKAGRHFIVTDESGLIPENRSESRSPFGLYREDTRYLSAWQFFIDGTIPRLLSSDHARGSDAQFIYGNSGSPGLPEQSLMLTRTIVIEDAVAERVVLTNFSGERSSFELAIVCLADFADMFEVRGTTRPERGSYKPAQLRNLWLRGGGRRVVFPYVGLDGVSMTTTVDCRSSLPLSVSTEETDCGTRAILKLNVELEAGASAQIEFAINTSLDGVTADSKPHRSVEKKLQSTEARYKAWRAAGGSITTSDTTLNQVLERGYKDLYLLRQPTPKGGCIAAGTPWFAAAFGRDQAIAALQMLPLMPELAKEVITVLAAYQGNKVESATEERPGKIMHELRLGEMARCSEIAFRPYYGTVDATPLWLMLMARYVKWTGDLKFVKSLWKNVASALDFVEIETRRTGYLTYGGKRTDTLINQGWKDSHDSVMHHDGHQATGPIALCEPQGYLYAAWTGWAEIAEKLGHTDLGHKLARHARTLKDRFGREFWMDDRACIALALDGDSQKCGVVSSNAGHLLSTGILSVEQEAAVSATLIQPDMFCGWGLRTLSSREKAYNPMSYHNGSVWPHDNAMVAEGLALANHKGAAHEILRGLLRVAGSQPDKRLPELFCGFDVAEHSGPIRYPVSCVPQAWAAGAMFQVLISCLGLEPEAESNRLRVVKPSLPIWLDGVSLKNLRIGAGRTDLSFTTDPSGKTECKIDTASDSLMISIDY